MLGDPRPHHYFFAHRFISRMFYDDPPNLMKMLLSPQGNGFIHHLWKRAAEIAEVQPLPSEGLGVSSHRTERGVTVVIHLPAPEGMTECFFLGLRMRKGKRYWVFFSKKPEYEYFTLELSVGEEPGQLRTVLGGWTPTATHSNYGTGPAPQVEQFVAVLEQF